MKKLICIILIFCMAVTLTGCGDKKQEADAGFKPALDTSTSCGCLGAYSADD